MITKSLSVRQLALLSVIARSETPLTATQVILLESGFKGTLTEAMQKEIQVLEHHGLVRQWDALKGDRPIGLTGWVATQVGQVVLARGGK